MRIQSAMYRWVCLGELEEAKYVNFASSSIPVPAWPICCSKARSAEIFFVFEIFAMIHIRLKQFSPSYPLERYIWSRLLVYRACSRDVFSPGQLYCSDQKPREEGAFDRFEQIEVGFCRNDNIHDKNDGFRFYEMFLAFKLCTETSGVHLEGKIAEAIFPTFCSTYFSLASAAYTKIYGCEWVRV